jgi:hypothetical protein
MKIENLITKRSRLDRRMKLTKQVNRWANRKTLASVTWATLTVLLVGLYIADNPAKYSQASPKTLGQTIEKEIVVEAVEPKCDDPLSYIRCKGQQLGYNDYDISKFILIAKAESETSTKYSKTVIPYDGVSGLGLDPYAKNPNSTAKGIFQFIDGTWRSYCLMEGNVYDYKANTNCFYKVLEVDGFPKGLSHWTASQHKWGK